MGAAVAGLAVAAAVVGGLLLFLRPAKASGGGGGGDGGSTLRAGPVEPFRGIDADPVVETDRGGVGPVDPRRWDPDRDRIRVLVGGGSRLERVRNRRNAFIPILPGQADPEIGLRGVARMVRGIAVAGKAWVVVADTNHFHLIRDQDQNVAYLVSTAGRMAYDRRRKAALREADWRPVPSLGTAEGQSLAEAQDIGAMFWGLPVATLPGVPWRGASGIDASAWSGIGRAV